MTSPDRTVHLQVSSSDLSNPPILPSLQRSDQPDRSHFQAGTGQPPPPPGPSCSALQQRKSAGRQAGQVW